LVGLALNFIVGDEVIPLDAEKHTETPLMEGIDPAILKGYPSEAPGNLA